MKNLILLAIVLVLSIPQISAAEDAKYEVTISITYNAVSPSRAAEIISIAQNQHRNACKVEIKSKKVSSDNVLEIMDGTGNLTQSWSIECMETKEEAEKKCGKDRYTQIGAGLDCFVCF